MVWHIEQEEQKDEYFENESVWYEEIPDEVFDDRLEDTEEDSVRETARQIAELEYDFEPLADGIYDVTDIEFMELPGMGRQIDKIEEFIRKHPNFVMASAYETDTTILLSRIPKRLVGSQYQTVDKATNMKVIGSGFNYGSTTILTNCPKQILIVAEND